MVIKSRDAVSSLVQIICYEKQTRKVKKTLKVSYKLTHPPAHANAKHMVPVCILLHIDGWKFEKYFDILGNMLIIHTLA